MAFTLWRMYIAYIAVFLAILYSPLLSPSLHCFHFHHLSITTISSASFSFNPLHSSPRPYLNYKIPVVWLWGLCMTQPLHCNYLSTEKPLLAALKVCHLHFKQWHIFFSEPLHCNYLSTEKPLLAALRVCHLHFKQWHFFQWNIWQYVTTTITTTTTNLPDSLAWHIQLWT